MGCRSDKRSHWPDNRRRSMEPAYGRGFLCRIPRTDAVSAAEEAGKSRW